MATPTPATEQELLRFLKKSPDAVDMADVTETLEAATEAAEGWVTPSGSIVGPIVVREFIDRVPADTGLLRLPHKPVQAVTSATRVSDGLEFLTAALVVDGVAGFAAGADEPIPDGDYDVVYNAGRDPVPVSGKRAVLIIAGHVWETQQGPTSAAFVGANQDSGHRVGAGYLIPNRAAHLLKALCES